MSTATATGLKAVVNRKAFLEAFGAAASLAPARTPKPVLQNVLFVATYEGSTLQATNLEVGIHHRVDGVTILEDGAVLLPSARTQSILRSIPDDEVTIGLDGDNILIQGWKAKFKLPSEDPSLFPSIPDFDEGTPHALVSADLLRQGIKRTAYAANPEDTRYALGGVCFEMPSGHGEMNMVGTDGRRLAVQSVELAEVSDDFNPPTNPIVPVKALQVVERLLSSSDHVGIAFVGEGAIGNGVLFRLDNAVVYSRLLEGRYPAWRNIIPSEPGIRVPFDPAEWLQAVQGASQTTSEESKGVDFEFNVKDALTGALCIKNQTADVGSSEVYASHAGEGVIPKFVLNARYFADFLKSVDGENEVVMHVIDGKSPIVFRCGKLESIIMPLTRD